VGVFQIFQVILNKLLNKFYNKKNYLEVINSILAKKNIFFFHSRWFSKKKDYLFSLRTPNCPYRRVHLCAFMSEKVNAPA